MPFLSLLSPFTRRISPLADQLQADVNRWIDEFQLAGPAEAAAFRAGQFGWLTARAYPDASYERMSIIGRCMVWTFANDDEHDGWTSEQLLAVHERFLAVLAGAEPLPGDSVQCRLLASLRDQLLPVAPAGWMERFRASVAGYLAGTRWEAPLRLAATVPDLAAYAEMRQYTVAMYLFTDLIEIAYDLKLPAEVREHPLLGRLTYLANIIVAWCNDLYSYRKELGNEVMNLVFVLQHERGLELTDAVGQAVAIHDEAVREFVALKDQLPSFGSALDAQVDRYIDCLETWMAGHIEWYEIDTQRYRREQAAPAELLEVQGELQLA